MMMMMMTVPSNSIHITLSTQIKPSQMAFGRTTNLLGIWLVRRLLWVDCVVNYSAMANAFMS